MGSAVGPRERGRRATQRKSGECSERNLSSAEVSLLWMLASSSPLSLFGAISASKLFDLYLEMFIYPSPECMHHQDVIPTPWAAKRLPP